MSISAINENLLRAIGVGIAIVGEDGLDFRFNNEKFIEWFGERIAPSLSRLKTLTIIPISISDGTRSRWCSPPIRNLH